MNFNFKNNYQITFLIILSVIILLQICHILNEPTTNDLTESTEFDTHQETETVNEKVLKKVNNPQLKRFEKYGHPTDIFDDKGSRIMFWKLNNKPWSSLHYNISKNICTFSLNALIEKDLLHSWNQIIPNIGFNDKDSTIIITTDDENSALALTNLILSTINQELTIKEIVESNLLDISLNKIRGHPLVKTKILEQINEKLSNKINHVKSDHSIDLATSKISIGAYGGNEFTFI